MLWIIPRLICLYIAGIMNERFFVQMMKNSQNAVAWMGGVVATFISPS
jgi:hypothetical protein